MNPNLPREWSAAWPERQRTGLPPAAPHRRGEGCGEQMPAPHPGIVCTRLEGHTGRHAASGIRYILGVWERS